MVRLAGYGGLNEIYRLICELERSELDFNGFNRTFREQLDHPDYSCWIWEEEGKIIGCLNLRMENQLHHAAKVAEIMELAVTDGHRSEGIGKQLFDCACHAAKEKGCVQLEVCCNLIRERAHTFYECQGLNRFHYQFSMPLTGSVPSENKLGI